MVGLSIYDLITTDEKGSAVMISKKCEEKRINSSS